MRLLLDTHTFLWCIIDDLLLSDRARVEIEKTSDEVLVGTASFWEISIKYGRGKPVHYPRMVSSVSLRKGVALARRVLRVRGPAERAVFHLPRATQRS